MKRLKKISSICIVFILIGYAYSFTLGFTNFFKKFSRVTTAATAVYMQAFFPPDDKTFEPFVYELIDVEASLPGAK